MSAQQADTAGFAQSFFAVIDLQLAKQIVDMSLDRTQADKQRFGNLRITLPPGHTLQYLALAAGNRFGQAQGLVNRPHQVRHQALQLLRAGQVSLQLILFAGFRGDQLLEQIAQGGPFIMQQLAQLELAGQRNRLVEPQAMGELFKVMAASAPGWPRPEGFGVKGAA